MYYPASSLDKELGLIPCRAIVSFAWDDCSHSEGSVFGTAWTSSVLRRSTRSIKIDENG